MQVSSSRLKKGQRPYNKVKDIDYHTSMAYSATTRFVCFPPIKMGENAVIFSHWNGRKYAFLTLDTNSKPRLIFGQLAFAFGNFGPGFKFGGIQEWQRKNQFKSESSFLATKF
ncbi:unnamed protein product [Clavelina lepadiformis]|uniref:Uncharacterized protein n=1 Tax=Clavelina lepadiformis TaxID=159417 RepID=A0ABP0G142_CLALP